MSASADKQQWSVSVTHASTKDVQHIEVNAPRFKSNKNRVKLGFFFTTDADTLRVHAKITPSMQLFAHGEVNVELYMERNDWNTMSMDTKCKESVVNPNGQVFRFFSWDSKPVKASGKKSMKAFKRFLDLDEEEDKGKGSVDAEMDAKGKGSVDAEMDAKGKGSVDAEMDAKGKGSVDAEMDAKGKESMDAEMESVDAQIDADGKESMDAEMDAKGKESMDAEMDAKGKESVDKMTLSTRDFIIVLPNMTSVDLQISLLTFVYKDGKWVREINSEAHWETTKDMQSRILVPDMKSYIVGPTKTLQISHKRIKLPWLVAIHARRKTDGKKNIELPFFNWSITLTSDDFTDEFSMPAHPDDLLTIKEMHSGLKSLKLLPEPAKEKPVKPQMKLLPEPADEKPAKPQMKLLPEPAGEEPKKPKMKLLPEPAGEESKKPKMKLLPEPAGEESKKPKMKLLPEPAEESMSEPEKDQKRKRKANFPPTKK